MRVKFVGQCGYTDVVCAEHKKDPGIPNNYPFKDQLLAEVAEQRRIVRPPSPPRPATTMMC